MPVETVEDAPRTSVTSEAPPPPTSSLPAPAPLIAAASLLATLAACGGGNADGSPPSAAPTPSGAPPPAPPPAASSPAPGPAPAPAPVPPPSPAPPTDAEASRFLAQASMGASRADIGNVASLGYAAWIEAQFALPASGTRWDWLVAQGYGVPANINSQSGFDAAAWRKMLSSPDTLRQRVTFALSEIFVAAIDGLVGPWPQFCGAAYLDLLEANAFGNHRTLLQQITLSPAMGEYLTYRGSVKANPTSGALPDENYARELMQLFTIGLVKLDPDGTTALANGAATPTYQLADITGLARVFTGWDYDLAGQTYAVASTTPDFMRRPMAQVASRYETGAKTFLGTSIPAGTSATQSLTQALDAIFAHPNVGPFFGRQLIQRLVTSNPSPAYVGRVAAAFDDDGSGTRGDMKAVVRAVLLDSEARASSAGSLVFGKLREPIMRFAGWARAYGVASTGGTWAGASNTSDPASGLAQSPLRSSTVFNFFRPGYVPPNTALDSAALQAPEFQIANETSVVGCVNYLQRAVAGSLGDLAPDYTALLALADDAPALLAEINVVLAANQVGSATLSTLATALATMPSGTAATRRARVNAALVMMLAAPEYIVQK